MKRLFIAIYILTILDVVCTVTGIKTGFITEANPLMQDFIEKAPIIAGVFVLVGVTSLLCLIYRLRKKIRWLKYALTGVVAVKVIIAGMHIGWILEMVRTL